MNRFNLKSLPSVVSLLIFIIPALFSQAHAAAFTGVPGDTPVTGSVFLGNDAVGDGSFFKTAGVGNVTEIIHAHGTLLFDNTSRELSLAFSKSNRTNLEPGFGGTTQFTSSGGIVDFYKNTLGAFQVTGDSIADALSISLGDHVLSLIGFEDVFVNVAVVQFGASSYSFNCYLAAQVNPIPEMLPT